MGKETGFLELDRHDRTYRDAKERLKHYKEFVIPLKDDELRGQASRCMNCGVPHCHTGCPVNNLIPDWNHLVYEADWKNALDMLHSTNNFPEFTGRICPAPCEAACTLNIIDQPVTIKSIECQIIDKGWENGWVTPQVSAERTGKSVAVVGSGPAGMACAQQLARAGHTVVLFEKNDRVGGLLRYGIPDFKMEKRHIDRRMKQMEAEGVEFRPSTEVGVTISIASLKDNFDAVVLSGGAEEARKLEIPGAELPGVELAMDFLRQQNKRNAGDEEMRAAPDGTISARGKNVIVIGGGDTGSDCVGTSNRQGARSVTQIEIMPKPPAMEDKAMTWPLWPLQAPHFVQPRGRRRARLGDPDQARGRRKYGAGPAMRPRRMDRRQDGRNRGQRVHAGSRSDPAGDGLCRSAQAGHARSVGGRARSARQRPGRHGRTTAPATRRSGPAATCGAARASSSGRSARAASAPARSTKR